VYARASVTVATSTNLVEEWAVHPESKRGDSVGHSSLK
jgi:hypothetical protein